MVNGCHRNESTASVAGGGETLSLSSCVKHRTMLDLPQRHSPMKFTRSLPDNKLNNVASTHTSSSHYVERTLERVHHHFYLPNNTTVCASTSIQMRKAGQQGPTRTLTAALKCSIKQLHNYYKGKVLQNKKSRKINILNVVRKAFKGVKFTVDGSAFQTFITHTSALAEKVVGLMRSVVSLRMSVRLFHSIRLLHQLTFDLDSSHACES